MMAFRTIDKALTDLLAASANGRYHVETAQRRAMDAAYIESHPIVTVFYEQGVFNRASGGPLLAQHDMTFRIEVMVAQPATVDLRILNDPQATKEQIMSAIAASTSATVNADDLIDDVLEYVYQVLRDPENDNLGLDAKTINIGNQWIGNFSKENPLPRGELVVLSGSWSYTCRATEYAVGATPVVLADIDTTIQETADITGAQTDSAAQGAEVQS